MRSCPWLRATGPLSPLRAAANERKRRRDLLPAGTARRRPAADSAHLCSRSRGLPGAGRGGWGAAVVLGDRQLERPAAATGVLRGPVRAADRACFLAHANCIAACVG